LDQYNKSAVKNGSTMVNGRRLTNVGLFRQYIQQYLKKHPDVNTELTCMVRQLESTETGLPLEVYCFSKDKDWVNYEKIQADIFDHILAVAGFFDIELFQNPSGTDFKKLKLS
jgi:miniconductance mechanosensitive channel